MNEIIFKKIEAVFKDVFHDPDLLIMPSYTAQDVAGWDSMTHMTLINALEENFGVVFTFEEVADFKTINDIIELLSEKTK